MFEQKEIDKLLLQTDANNNMIDELNKKITKRVKSLDRISIFVSRHLIEGRVYNNSDKVSGDYKTIIQFSNITGEFEVVISSTMPVNIDEACLFQECNSLAFKALEKLEY